MLISIPDEIAYRVSFDCLESDVPAIKKATKAANVTASLEKALADELDSPDPATRVTALKAIAQVRAASENDPPNPTVQRIHKSLAPAPSAPLEIAAELSYHFDPRVREAAFRDLHALEAK